MNKLIQESWVRNILTQVQVCGIYQIALFHMLVNLLKEFQKVN